MRACYINGMGRRGTKRAGVGETSIAWASKEGKREWEGRGTEERGEGGRANSGNSRVIGGFRKPIVSSP